MPVSYQWQSDVLYLTASGHYEPADIPKQFMAGLADPTAVTPARLLLDVRESEVLAGRSPQQIRRVAEFLYPHADRIGRKCAVVVTRDVHFGLSRMGTMFCEDVGVQADVFRSPEEAIEWLRGGA